MKNNKIILLLGIFLIVPLFLPGTVRANEVHLEEIELAGLQYWPESDVRLVLSEAGLTAGDTYSENELEQLTDRSLQRLQEEGLFSDIRVRRSNNRLRFQFDEYPPVKEVVFEGNEQVGDDRLRNVILLQKESPASSRNLRETRQQLKEYYEMQGFGEARVSVKKELDSEGKVVVKIKIEEDFQKKISNVYFSFEPSIGYLYFLHRRWRIGWSIPLKEGAPYSARRVQFAKSAIVEWYYNRGHLDVEIDVETYNNPREEGVDVTFVIDEGPVYRLGEIDFTGNELFDDKKLRQLIPLGQGEVFSREQFHEGLSEIQQTYEERGYAEAQVLSPDRYRLQRDRENKRVDIGVQISEGDPLYVERVEIYGNQATYDRVIRREIPLEAGELLDGKKLRNARRRLRNLGFFSKVDVSVDPGLAKNKRVIRVRVEERPTGQLQFGGGYSSSTGFMGQFQIKKDNFSFYDYDQGFTGRGQSLSANLQVGSQQDNYRISWDNPWINDDLDEPSAPIPEYPVSFGVTGFNQLYRRDEGYDQTRQGGSLRMGREFGAARANKIDLEYSFRRVKVTELQDSDSDDIPTDIWDENNGEDFDREIGSLEVGLQRDWRDDRLFPSEGYYLRGSVETAAGDIFGGNSDYYRPRLDVREYLPFWGPTFWAFRANYETIDSWEDEEDDPIPAFERLYLGGFRTVRGYDYRDIRVYEYENGEVDGKGGNAAFFVNLELRVELVEQTMQGFTFFDAGQVYDEAWELKNENLRRSVGFGFRIHSPIGPMILSWGQRLDETYRGADDTGDWDLNFNIGTGF
ncbi:MAG: outer membrane protein assembly factor BamA [bacterium]